MGWLSFFRHAMCACSSFAMGVQKSVKLSNIVQVFIISNSFFFRHAMCACSSFAVAVQKSVKLSNIVQVFFMSNRLSQINSNFKHCPGACCFIGNCTDCRGSQTSCPCFESRLCQAAVYAECFHLASSFHDTLPE